MYPRLHQVLRRSPDALHRRSKHVPAISSLAPSSSSQGPHLEVQHVIGMGECLGPDIDMPLSQSKHRLLASLALPFHLSLPSSESNVDSEANGSSDEHPTPSSNESADGDVTKNMDQSASLSSTEEEAGDFMLVKKRHSRQAHSNPGNCQISFAKVGASAPAQLGSKRVHPQTLRKGTDPVLSKQPRQTPGDAPALFHGGIVQSSPLVPRNSGAVISSPKPVISVMAAAIAAGVVPPPTSMTNEQQPGHSHSSTEDVKLDGRKSSPYPHQSSSQRATPLSPSGSQHHRKLNPNAAVWQPSTFSLQAPVPGLDVALTQARVDRSVSDAGARPCLISRLPASQVSGCECLTCCEYAEALSSGSAANLAAYF